MTEHRSPTKGPPVLWLSLATFLVVLTVLAIRMSRGEDPAVGAGGAAPAQPRRVLVRRIVKRVVVTHVIPPPVVEYISPVPAAGATPAAAAAPATSPVPSRAAAPAPVASAPAPVAAAPAPPPPAPAPAAPVTRSS
jgi:hypothetical protein